MSTVLEALTIAAREFARAGIESPRLNAELLLAHALGCRRLDLYLRFDQPLDPTERTAFGALYRRRLTREPLQYIVASQHFCGLEFTVDRRALIPRPETEELVETVLRRAAARGRAPRLSILDIGTGSGCIAVTLGARLPESVVTGIDVSDEALTLARHNAAILGVPHATFLLMDVLATPALPATYDIIVSNPPYVPGAEWETLQPEVRDFEPRLATTDGDDGLTFFRRIAALAPSHLHPEGFVAMEIGMGQVVAVRGLLEAAGFNVEIVDDLAGIPRIVMAMRNDQERRTPSSTR